MSIDAQAALDLARRYGVAITARGDKLCVRAPHEPPPFVLDQIREAKADLLAALVRTRRNLTEIVAPEKFFERRVGSSAMSPCNARRGHVVMHESGVFEHYCRVCGRWGVFGYGVDLRVVQLGRWFCCEHKPS